MYVVFLGVGRSCSSQLEITFATLYCLFYLIKLTKLLNAHEGSVNCRHLNNRRLEGIRYDSKEKHEYNLKDLRPKGRKPPFDSDMLYIEVI